MHAVSIHTNVVGGMTMSEPANDLAVAVAIASSYYEQPIARDIVCIGEVGESLSCLLQTVIDQGALLKANVLWFGSIRFQLPVAHESWCCLVVGKDSEFWKCALLSRFGRCMPSTVGRHHRPSFAGTVHGSLLLQLSMEGLCILADQDVVIAALQQKRYCGLHTLLRISLA